MPSIPAFNGRTDLDACGMRSYVYHMRLLAWLAVFSLQLGMFVCGAGIDVCHAADASMVSNEASLLPDMPADDDADVAPSDQVCTAHAAHVFLGVAVPTGAKALPHIDVAMFPAALQLPECDHLIEQPPKFARS